LPLHNLEMASEHVDLDLNAARAAKQKVSEQLSGNPLVRGIGITRVDHRYAVKVNVAKADAVHVPDEVDGVPVRVVVVGDLVAY
jgi:hypothetical protein